MRSVPKWIDKIQDAEKQEQCIYDLCFTPDGSQLIVASGNRILVYSTEDGTLIQTLKGHKDNVYCLNYAKNGHKFASGGADKSVIIWSNKLEGLLKYSHSDAVQCVAYNPLSNQLASCAITDFAFWSSEQKAVQKHKINARINSCSWTNDGQYLALALGNGYISIRNKLGEEKGRFERPGNPTIWAISWSTSNEEQDTLCVTDWNKTLTFYSLGGKLIGKERGIGYDALKLKYFPNGEYILISGTNKSCTMYTKEGIRLGIVGDLQGSWIWCCAVHPNSNYVALGCQDGTILYYQLIFNTVHGLYKERYAFRENMTDVIIQHLLTEQKVRIKCRDLIKKIAIFKHRLAVQLPERVIIYELYSNDGNDMHYKVKEKITQKLECSLLVICSEHLVICQERKLLSMSFSGVQEREWELDSSIRYIKIIGGPPRQEGLVLGLKNGQVWEVHLDNPFPLLKVSVNGSIRCLDLSQRKQKLAVVDESGLCQVFNTKNGDLLYQEPNTNSIAWNTQYENMLAFSGTNSLSIKVDDFPAHRQKLNGFVVGLTGSKVFCLNGSMMTTLELPLSASMYQYIEKKMFVEAHKVACLGVTDGDWQDLAHASLENLNFDIARLAFIKLQDFNYLELIRDLQERARKGENNKEVMIGDIYAYSGKFKEAARLYQKAGQEHKALTMYTDLRMFDQAQDYLGSSDNSTLIRQKAEWAKNINEHKAAVDMYLSIGDTKTAIDILGDQGWADQLIDVGRRLDKAERVSLIAIAEHLRRLNLSAPAAEIYKRLGDSAAVLKLHVEAKEWAQAFSIIQSQPQHKALVYVPYAHWLAENDKFVQAQKAFHKAGKLEESVNVLQQLTENAVDECRFQDAGYYYWILAQQCLDIAREHPETRDNMITNYNKNERLAGIYYGYHSLHRYLEEPFTSFMPEALFNIARFILTETHLDRPKGISLFNILYCLSKQARKLGANKLTKQLMDRMQSLKIPQKFQEQVEVASIAAKARPYSDPEELLPMCYRCSTYNPLAITSNKCVNCGQKFVHSYVSFEILPLVEFFVEDDISDIEAVRLIQTPQTDLKGDNEQSENLMQNNSGYQEILQIDNFKNEYDPFVSNKMNFMDVNKEVAPIVLNRNGLVSLDSSAILICKFSPPLKYKYFRNLLPDLQITMCDYCFKAFHVDDFELQMLQKGYCPFCRSSPESNAILDASDEVLGL